MQVPHFTVAKLFANTESVYGFDESDVWTMFHSYAFDFSVWELWGPLLYGGTLVVVDYVTSRSPEQFLELLAAERVTVLNQTPSAFYQLAEADRLASESGLAAELSLRWVVFGGEALELRRLSDWYGRRGDSAPTLVNMYGITETTVHVSIVCWMLRWRRMRRRVLWVRLFRVCRCLCSIRVWLRCLLVLRVRCMSRVCSWLGVIWVRRG